MERNAEIIRQWKILKAIESASDWTIPKLAREFEVCDRTIRRDLTALQEAGFPLYDDCVNGHTYWRLSARPFKGLGDTAFTVSELCAFHVDRARLAKAGGSPVGGDLQTAIAKVTRALSPQMRRYLDRLTSVLGVKPDAAAGRCTAPARVQDDLVRATLDHRRIEMTYHSFAHQRVRPYSVEPYRLTVGNGGLYLFAFVPQYGQMRTFAVQRIRKLRVLEERFDPVSTAGDDDPYRDSFGVFTGKPEAVEIEFDSGIAPYIEERDWHPSQEITKQADGSIVLRMNISVDVSLRSWILGFGHAARVLKPADLAEAILEELEEAREQYAPSMHFEMPPSVYRSRAQRMLPFAPPRRAASHRRPSRRPTL